MAAPSPWPSRAVGDPVVRRQHTSEAEVGAPFIPVPGLTSQCPSHEGAGALRFMPPHRTAPVVRRSFRRVHTFTTGDWGSSSLAFTVSAGSNAACRTASSDSRALLPACSGPVGLSTAGQLVAQAPPSSASWLRQGCDDAPHGAHRACSFPAPGFPRSFIGSLSELPGARSRFHSSDTAGAAGRTPSYGVASSGRTDGSSC
jgi:hypothetical protein